MRFFNPTDNDELYQPYFTTMCALKYDRIKINGIIYQSTDWARGNRNSYFISYEIDSKKFGVVKHYLLNEQSGQFFAVTANFDNIGNLKSTMKEPNNVLLKEMFINNMYGNFHFLVRNTKHISLVPVYSIISRCIVLYDRDSNMYVTEADTGFEHN